MKKFSFVLIFYFTILLLNQTVISKENDNAENQNHLKCVFTITEYDRDELIYDSSFLRSFSNIQLYVEFLSTSKFNWNITDIYLSDNFKESILIAFEEEKLLWKKVIYNQKLSTDEKKLFETILKALNYSLSQFEKEIKQLSQNEKKEFMKSYEEEEEKLLLDIDNFIKNQKTFFKEIIQIFDINKDINVIGSKVIIRFVTDSGILIKNIIDYNKLLKSESKDSVKIKITFINGNSVSFSSKCLNTTNLIEQNHNNKSNNIETKLKKLKSLFEEELITKEEYDAKRKEILDDM